MDEFQSLMCQNFTKPHVESLLREKEIVIKYLDLNRFVAIKVMNYSEEKYNILTIEDYGSVISVKFL